MTDELAHAHRQIEALLAEREQQREEIKALQRAIAEDATTLRAEAIAGKRLREALDHVPSYLYMKDAQSRFVYANQATLDLFGCTREALVGRLVGDFFRPAFVGAMETADARILAGETVVEEVVIGAGPDRRVFREEKSPIYTDATRREIWGVCSISTDLTDRIRAEESLLESEERFRTVFTEAPLGVVLSDAETGQMTAVNARFAEIVGRPMSDLTGRDWMSFTHPEDMPDQVKKSRALAAGTITRFQQRKRYRRSDGSYVWVSITVASLGELGGGAHRTNVTMVEDISTRIAAENELRKLSQAVEQSPVSILITNVRAEIEYVNAAFLRTTGYAREEVFGQNPRMLHSGATSPSTYAALWNVLSRGDTWTGEFTNRRKDGSDYIELAVISPLREPDGAITHYVAVQEDLTAQRHLLAELSQHKDQLVQLVDARTRELVDARELAETANRAKSAFLAAMSHEIRTPLNGVIALAELLSLRPLSPDDLDLAQTINRAAHNLLEVVNDVLDFSKIEAGKLDLEVADLSLHQLTDDLEATLFPLAASSDVDLAVEVAPTVPALVRGDAACVRQILMNLTGNAIKFSRGRTAARGRVSLVVDAVSVAPLRVVFRVADNGIGISPAAQRRLFASFTQADSSTTRRFGGSGLGLAICRRLVDLMEGTIEVASVEGYGSTFTVTLPFQPAGPPCADGPSSDAHEPEDRPLVHAPPLSVANARAQGRLILVAEDDTTNQKVILRQLAVLGYAGEIASNGAEALQMWRRGGYALVLTDLHMPMMDGYELVAAIRREEASAKRVPVLALTANALHGEAERATQAGMDGYMTKPVPLARLLDILNRWILPGREAADESSLNRHPPQ